MAALYLYTVNNNNPFLSSTHLDYPGDIIPHAYILSVATVCNIYPVDVCSYLIYNTNKTEHTSGLYMMVIFTHDESFRLHNTQINKCRNSTCSSRYLKYIKVIVMISILQYGKKLAIFFWVGLWLFIDLLS